VDFGLAFFAFETTGTHIRALLLRSLIKQAAFGAGKYNRGLGSAGHQQSVHSDSGICQPKGSISVGGSAFVRRVGLLLREELTSRFRCLRSALDRYCCKSRKSNAPENLAKVDF
jgi:hypothetical protein